MIVGSITALFMGFMGIIQNDIKRVVAYSTLSQLGYMTVALGASAYSVAMFHVMTHAFFKALLFLASGSVIIGMHHNQDIRYMGGLWKYMKVTWIAFLLGSLSLIGTPFFSGFYSKDSIIEAVHFTQYGWVTDFAIFSLLIGVFVTAFYSFRVYFLVFHGEERYDKNSNQHHNHIAFEKPHESSMVVTIPLVILAIPSVIIGFFTIEPLLFDSFFGSAIKVLNEAHPVMTKLKENWHGSVLMVLHGIKNMPFFLALFGVITAWCLYIKWKHIPEKIRSKLMPLYILLENKYYLDMFNHYILAKGALLIGNFFYKFCDQILIDGVMVNGSWKMVAWISSILRLFQTGYIYHYAFAMITGLIVMLYFVL
jgi:NADH-quinone oxidoreductase subunit L